MARVIAFPAADVARAIHVLERSVCSTNAVWAASEVLLRALRDGDVVPGWATRLLLFRLIDDNTAETLKVTIATALGDIVSSDDAHVEIQAVVIMLTGNGQHHLAHLLRGGPAR